jgi:hypothetical protein
MIKSVRSFIYEDDDLVNAVLGAHGKNMAYNDGFDAGKEHANNEFEKNGAVVKKSNNSIPAMVLGAGLIGGGSYAGFRGFKKAREFANRR